jgi:hypothetical protein
MGAECVLLKARAFQIVQNYGLRDYPIDQALNRTSCFCHPVMAKCRLSAKINLIFLSSYVYAEGGSDWAKAI